MQAMPGVLDRPPDVGYTIYKGIDILNLDKVAKLSVEGKTSVAFNRFQNVPPELIRLVMGTLPIDFGGAY